MSAPSKVVRLGTRVLTIPLAPLLLLVLVGPAAAEIWEDALGWERPIGRRAVDPRDGRVMWLTYLLAKLPEFRTLAYYRTGRHGRGWAAIGAIAGRVYKPQVALTIDCAEIGPRLFIEHGFSTVITATKIGADCWINQNVTIGRGSRPGCPVLGDRVYVRAGAVISGPVHLRDGSHVGANSVVTRDVPAWTVVGGTPARPIRTT